MKSPDIALVMPMAGRGSRFSNGGEPLPKPLIELHGRPFFWWATQSVLRQTPVRELIYVVLAEHVQRFDIQHRILSYFPQAKVVVINEVTNGAAETARLGVESLAEDGPVAINDCDHAFDAPALPTLVQQLQAGLDGALMCFTSASPAYSYAETGADGLVRRTVEKQVISSHAIAGCYFFGRAASFRNLYQAYAATCPYSELFISGLFNLMIEQGCRVSMMPAREHCSFGTPQEQAAVTPALFAQFAPWISDGGYA